MKRGKGADSCLQILGFGARKSWSTDRRGYMAATVRIESPERRWYPARCHSYLEAIFRGYI